MSVISDPPRGGGAVAPEERPGSAPVPDVPARADGIEMLGTMAGSGYRRPPALVRRRDGQVLQLTPLLYRVLDAVDGQRTYAQIADRVSAEISRPLDEAGARSLVDGQLRQLGVVRLADGSEPAVRKANPLLALRFRYVVTDPERTRRLTAPFARLFNPVLAIAVLIAFGWICKWVLFDRGLGFAAHQAFARPGLLLAIFAITLVSAGFHEFGHAAAARYGGATPGVMGAGLYLVWPAFYTDVTDSYRLGRGGRLRTDLGGLYFNAVLSVAIFGLWWVTGWDALLLVIATQLIQMIRQLPPMLRFDGYHLLADITGVPDLFHQIKPTLLGLLPTHWRRQQPQVLKPWARAVVTLWVLLVVPLMAMTVLISVITLPRILATAAVSLDQHWHVMTKEFGDGKILAGLASILAVVAISVPMLGITYMLWRFGRQIVGGTLRATAGRPGRRALAAVLAAALVAGLAVEWWPHGNYRQIQAYERGTLQDAFPAALHTGLQSGSGSGVWPADAGAVPSADHPALAMVLIPRAGNGPTWVFPFDRPLPPGLGDNQTLAVNTKNGSSVYDVAFALVWANGHSVLNKNEAYAFASCSHCSAEAISFQIILIVGQANVVIPQNISAAVNYNCIVCVTQALAVQLVLTLPGQPSAQEIRDINALWRQIQAWSKHIKDLPFAVIHARMADYEQQMIAIITKDSGGAAPTVLNPSGSGATTAGAPGTSGAASSVAPGQVGATTSGAPSAPASPPAGTSPPPGSSPAPASSPPAS